MRLRTRRQPATRGHELDPLGTPRDLLLDPRPYLGRRGHLTAEEVAMTLRAAERCPAADEVWPDDVPRRDLGLQLRHQCGGCPHVAHGRNPGPDRHAEVVPANGEVLLVARRQVVQPRRAAGVEKAMHVRVNQPRCQVPPTPVEAWPGPGRRDSRDVADQPVLDDHRARAVYVALDHVNERYVADEQCRPHCCCHACAGPRSGTVEDTPSDGRLATDRRRDALTAAAVIQSRLSSIHLQK